MFEFDYDAQNGYPETPEDLKLDWVHFNADILSTEWDTKAVVSDVVDANPDAMVDLRPYMIEGPQSVTMQTKFYRVLEQFRLNHLRHMPVVDPSTGKIKGIITRKDIFRYNGL